MHHAFQVFFRFPSLYDYDVNHESVFSSKSVKKSVKRGIRDLHAQNDRGKKKHSLDLCFQTFCFTARGYLNKPKMQTAMKCNYEQSHFLLGPANRTSHANDYACG